MYVLRTVFDVRVGYLSYERNIRAGYVIGSYWNLITIVKNWIQSKNRVNQIKFVNNIVPEPIKSK